MVCCRLMKRIAVCFTDAKRKRRRSLRWCATAISDSVLFGESGSGKTSLLRAGLIPRLWEEGYVPILCRSYSDPLADAVEQCERRCNLSRAHDEPAASYLPRVAREVDGTLVIICDQFEEFFVNHKTKQDRDPFLSFLEACHADRELPVKFLASMRSDFLYSSALS